MPIKFAFKNNNYAIWTYDPNEHINIDNFCNVTQLTITTELDIHVPNLTLPSLYGFIYLQKLSILNIPVTTLTDIGSATILNIQCTLIRSIDLIDTTRLTKLSLYTNNNLILVKIPETVTDFSAVFQKFGDLYVHSAISRLILMDCTFKYLYYIPESLDNLTIQDCKHFYQFTNITKVSRIRQIIRDWNIASKYATTYALLGRLPNGTILSEQCIQSSITKVMWLSSNYPRRMAEFCIDPTCI